MRRRVNISASLPLDLVEILEELPGRFLSEKIARCITLYDQIQKYKEIMNDPEKSKEFQNIMQEKLLNDEMEQWADTLTNQQIEGFIGFLQVQQELRHKQGDLR